MYKKAGRWMVCIYGPWINLNEAFRRGLAKDGFFELEKPDDQEDDEIDEQNDIYIKFYRSTLALAPNFIKSIEALDDDFESIMDLISLVRCVLILPHLH
jgi:hypothetical protein